MRSEKETRVRWRWGVAAAALLALVALIPQLHLWAARGREWRGSFASVHLDETAYAAYVRALADGRPRRNDPFAQSDDEPEVAQSESLFSIQFLPAYALALPARLLGVSTSAVFVALYPLCAFASALALFRLLCALTRDARLSAAGALFVLAFGAPARGRWLAWLLAGEHPAQIYLPFLRRYLPALPFPVFFVFCLFVWRALDSKTARASLAWACGAGALFAVLVHSYFYLWTAAAAWLAWLALLLPALRREGRTRALATFGALAAFASAALAPHALLLSRRSPELDAAQGLARTHAPDLLRAPELLGLAALAALALAARRGLADARSQAFVFAASFALLPLAVFNQQVFTGRSLQPVHYELYIANYSALLAAILAAWFFWKARDDARARPQPITNANDLQLPSRAATGHEKLFPATAALAIALASLGWAAFEVVSATKWFAHLNVPRDAAYGVALRLSELEREGSHAARDESEAGRGEHEAERGGSEAERGESEAERGGLAAERGESESGRERLMTGRGGSGTARGESDASRARGREFVFARDARLIEALPTVAPQALLWSPWLAAFPGSARAENVERLHLHLYYAGVDEREFAAVVANYGFALFGPARAIKGLDAHATPISEAELRAEVLRYSEFVAAFDRARAARHPLAYAVVPAARAADLHNLDRWYERDAGERTGDFIIHRVRLRP